MSQIDRHQRRTKFLGNGGNVSDLFLGNRKTFRISAKAHEGQSTGQKSFDHHNVDTVVSSIVNKSWNTNNVDAEKRSLALSAQRYVGDERGYMYKVHLCVFDSTIRKISSFANNFEETITQVVYFFIYFFFKFS